MNSAMPKARQVEKLQRELQRQEDEGVNRPSKFPPEVVKFIQDHNALIEALIAQSVPALKRCHGQDLMITKVIIYGNLDSDVSFADTFVQTRFKLFLIRAMRAAGDKTITVVEDLYEQACAEYLDNVEDDTATFDKRNEFIEEWHDDDDIHEACDWLWKWRPDAETHQYFTLIVRDALELRALELDCHSNSVMLPEEQEARKNQAEKRLMNILYDRTYLRKWSRQTDDGAPPQFNNEEDRFDVIEAAKDGLGSRIDEEIGMSFRAPASAVYSIDDMVDCLEEKDKVALDEEFVQRLIESRESLPDVRLERALGTY
ncbi:hypothetical protein NA57DRAFT_54523 [Rhizodiscina lignyota]|uniref:Uncharacterized protein n=1 Tax=Rhizodiscina lignyota TaxID=1504668 RepID=A0A9P4MC90_9PEZI|nr:hypothetical protein NA57DRAFT_54523 [Rhizodiscina lignyota]